MHILLDEEVPIRDTIIEITRRENGSCSCHELISLSG